MPVFTVVMPIYNTAQYVQEALRSVLEQEGADLDIIVVDDGSTDGSPDIVRSFNDPRIRLVMQEHLGVTPARNQGLALARGEFYTQCDADDLFPPGRLAWQQDWLRAHPEFGVVCGATKSIDPQGRFIAELHYRPHAMEVTEELRAGKIPAHNNAWAIRTPLLREIGGFRPYFKVSEDIDLMLRLGGHTRVWYDPRISYYLRLRDSSITHTKSVSYVQFFRGKAFEFQRQRMESGMDDLERGAPPAPVADEARGAACVHDQISQHMAGQAWIEREKGRPFRACITALRACMRSPRRLAYWRTLGVLAVLGLIRPVRKG